MLGFSVFLGDEFQESKREYIEKMFQSGFKRMFTSLHIPEDDVSRVLDNLNELCKIAKELNLSLMVDISSDGLQRLQIDLNDDLAIRRLLSLGVTGIRMDYGIDYQTMARVSQQLIAGGMKAMTVTVEGAEDSVALGRNDLVAIGLTENDIVIGIAASGRTPYVIGGLNYANEAGATTATVACNLNAAISCHATYPIEVEVGPEVLTGSTRLKAGTAQKLVLNMLSTVAMIGIGKVYNNLMVDVRATNEKLVERAKRIIMQATDCSYEMAETAFVTADENVKLAIVMILTGEEKETAAQKLVTANGFVRQTL